ncbi:MAG: hypothetical protein FJX22_04910 [Alphaproteobacteria bacterium]|nr:hypothetical protein [Alphaproteobacteria bacterium]
MLHAIREKSTEDPLIGAKIGAKEILNMFLQSMKEDKGVHVESLLCALGSLGGIATQASIRAQNISNSLPETASLSCAESNNGSKFYFGDDLNHVLAGDPYSVLSLAAAEAEFIGAKDISKNYISIVKELLVYSTETMGGEKYGIPRLPQNHMPASNPIEYAKLWPVIKPKIELFCPNPSHWPVLFGLAIQKTLDESKDVVDTAIALQIVMESAVPMSKIDLDSLNVS